MRAAVLISLCLLFAASARAGEEEAYVIDPGHAQLDTGIFVFKLNSMARLGATGTFEDFTDFGIDDFSFSLAGRFAYEMDKVKYFAEYWSYGASSNNTLDHDVTWNGDDFLIGESVQTAFDFNYFGLGMDKIIIDASHFRLAATVGYNFVGLNYSLTDPTRGGGFDETVSALTVGFAARAYFTEELTMYLDMVGLSWTDLIGMDSGFFSPNGGYRVMDVGFMWSRGGVSAFRAGYKFFSMDVDETNEAAGVEFQGAYIGVDFRW